MVKKENDIIDYGEWLKDPRNTEVVDPVAVTGKYYIGPASYGRGHYPNWGVLRNREANEGFLLTERTFKGVVDAIFSHIPSLVIAELINEGRRPDVLDVGGGKDGLTAREIAREYPEALVTNVDIVAVPREEGNFRSIRADILELPLKDASFDFAYSHQVLPYFAKTEELSRQRRVLNQIARVLRPGGIALVDDGSFSALEARDQRRGLLEGELGASVLFGQKRRGDGFLFIAKDPLNLVIAESVERTRRAA